jgi:hypothetical protein
MRCNASPTTCTAADDARAAAARTVAAILFREVLKPLAAGLGPLGETALGPLADRIAGVVKR